MILFVSNNDYYVRGRTKVPLMMMIMGRIVVSVLDACANGVWNA